MRNKEVKQVSLKLVGEEKTQAVILRTNISLKV